MMLSLISMILFSCWCRFGTDPDSQYAGSRQGSGEHWPIRRVYHWKGDQCLYHSNLPCCAYLFSCGDWQPEYSPERRKL